MKDLSPKEMPLLTPVRRKKKRSGGVSDAADDEIAKLYATRYGSKWEKISRQCKESTNYECCFSGCGKIATESHHAVYFDKLGSVRDREIAGVHIFPLCDLHHAIAHRSMNWLHSQRNSVLGNRNTPAFYKKLRAGYLAKRQEIEDAVRQSDY